MRYIVQYCVLYSFCCNVRPVSPRIRTSVLTASLRQNADGACLIITRTRRRALFVSDSLSRQYPSLLTRTPKRKSITLRSRLRAGRVADGKYTPQKNARTQSNMTTAESIARCHRIYVGTCATGTCLFFCFLGGRLRTFLRAFRLRNGRREVSPPRILAPRQVYKSEAWRLYLILSRTQRRTHQTRLRQCRKKLRSLATAVGKRFKRLSFTVRQRSGISHSFSLQIADAPQNNASSVALL